MNDQDQGGSQREPAENVEREGCDSRQQGCEQAAAALEEIDSGGEEHEQRDRQVRVVLHVAEEQRDEPLGEEHRGRPHPHDRVTRATREPIDAPGGECHSREHAADRDRGGSGPAATTEPVEKVVDVHRQRLVGMEGLAAGDVDRERERIAPEQVAFAQDPEQSARGERDDSGEPHERSDPRAGRNHAAAIAASASDAAIARIAGR